MRIAIVAGTLVTISALSLAQPPPPSGEAQMTYQDMQKTLGFVPGFYKAFPDEAIAGAWEEQKAIELNPKSALPPATKELIGLAVAAQIPCKYCVYFHTRVARANGANDNQVKEAIAISALTRHWSTVMNGLQIDFTQFKQEVGKMFDYVAKHQQQSAQAGSGADQITDANAAFDDMRRTYGMVPAFMMQFPPEGVPGAWREMKALDMSPTTAIDAKGKALIGLAVSAQVPCTYCVFYETAAARRAGATDAEIREAVAMAAITRHWSTVLNGSMIDENAFRRDVDRLVKQVEKSAKTAEAGGANGTVTPPK